MDAVIESYFEESHRGLQAKKGQPQGSGAQGGGGGHGNLGGPASSSSGAAPPHHQQNYSQNQQLDTFNLAAEPLFQVPKETILRNLLEEKYEEVLKDNERLQRKLRQAQDTLSIVTAKKQVVRSIYFSKMRLSYIVCTYGNSIVKLYRLLPFTVTIFRTHYFTVAYGITS